jgi:Cof subfamily protein (haloacid dehalogenase superfamily)
MDIAMIVTDLDNTLLTSDKRVSPRTVKALTACQSKGILVAFATARPPRTVERFVHDVYPDAVAYHNGAIVRTARGDVLRAAMTLSEARELAARMLAEDARASIGMEVGDGLFANFDMSHIRGCDDFILSDFAKLPDEPVYKLILGVRGSHDIARIARLLPEGLYVERCEDTLALVMARGATKLNGVRRMAQASGIPLERVAAFGDDMNDVEMLRACGVGVAMGNGIAEAKAAADYVCLRNDEDGVAVWLEGNLL